MKGQKLTKKQQIRLAALALSNSLGPAGRATIIRAKLYEDYIKKGTVPE